MKTKYIILIKRVILFAALIAFWFFASKSVDNPVFVPDPGSVWENLVTTAQSGTLWLMIWYSFRRISFAVLISAGIALPLGLLNHNFTVAHDIINPIVSLMRFIPVTAFYPVLILWFGINEQMKIAFLFIATFVSMLPSVVLALEEVNQDLIDTGLSLGMNKFQTIYMIQLPASLPAICKSFILQFGICWSYIAIAETVNAVYGLGFTIQQSQARGRMDMVFMSIIVIIIFSVLFDAVANWVVKKIFRWRYIND